VTAVHEPHDKQTEVVVVGAGPVGLMLAAELRRARVPVVVVERLASPMTESRASMLTTLTAELLAERGFGSLLLEAAPEPRTHFGGLSFDLSGLDSDQAGNWKVPQYRTESALELRARQLGATVLRAHEMTGLVTSASADRVTCVARGPGGDVRVQARYLVGCDGAESAVRRLGGFTSAVTRATRQLLRADVTGIEIRDRRFERLDGGFAAAGTRAGVTRVMVHAPGHEVAEPGFADVVRLWAKVTGEDISGGQPIWVDGFDNATGLVEEYRRGRVLLAGDAAHWHMPIGGQALNVGLQDAVNLGWKLAAVVNGRAHERLLDTYHHERRAIAARVLDYVTAQEMLLLGGLEIEPLRAVLAELIGLDPVRGHLARVVTGLDDRYGQRGSPLAGRRVPGVRLRDESGALVTAGLALGTEPVLVRLTASAEVDLPIRTIHATPDEVRPGVTMLLLRPDGYIAWAGDDDTELTGAIEQLTGGKEWNVLTRT